METKKIFDDIVSYMKRLCDSGLTTSLGGNISCRIGDNMVAITPSSIDKASLCRDDIVVVNMNGDVMSGKYKPSMEYMMHVMVYQNRPDVFAIIHAHPHFSTIFSTSDLPICLDYTAEACKNIKSIGKATFRMMGSIELANEVAEKAKKANVVLMENHGVLTVGNTLLQAYYRMEILEQAAQMTYRSLSLPMNKLPEKECQTLKKM